MRADVFIATTIGAGILFHQLLKRRIKRVDLLFPLISACTPFIWVYIQNKTEAFLIAQLALSLLPVANMILSRSISSSLALYGINIANSLLILKPRIHEVLPFDEDDPRYIMISMFISKSFGFGLGLLGTFWYFHNSRAHLILKLYEKQKELEILNKELKDKNIQLEEIAQSKMNMFLSVSHEVRNPLNIISGFTELALMDEPNEKTVPLLNTIQSATKLLLFLINNLLDTYKMDHQELELFKDHIKTFDFIKTIWNSSKMLIAKKNLYGHLFISKNMPEYMEIDEMRVTQIIYNLVGNATKFTTQGYVSLVFTRIESESIRPMMNEPTEESYFREFLSQKIPKSTIYFNALNHRDNEISAINLNDDNSSELSIIEESLMYPKHKIKFLHCAKNLSYIGLFREYYNIDMNQANFPSYSYQPPSQKHLITAKKKERKGYLKIEVIDSGYGIHPDKFQDLFKKFGQVGHVSQNRLGSGLGLWISKTMCTRMEGSLGFFSEPNKGSVFIALIKPTFILN